MANTNWLRQTSEEPLFEELLWSRPQNRRWAKKLLIIGGNSHGFAAPAEAYMLAEKAGAGSVRVLLPDAIQKLVGGFFEHALFAPSTPSGSFAKLAVGEAIEETAWADGVLVAGDLGRNAETAIFLETFCRKYSGPVTVTKDAVDYFKDSPVTIIDRADTTIVASYAQLQKLAQNAKFTEPFVFDTALTQLVERMQSFSLAHPGAIVVKHLDQVIVACNGSVSTTKLSEDKEVWRVATAASAAVWHMQNPGKQFEAVTTSLV